MTLHPINRKLALALGLVAIPAFWPGKSEPPPVPLTAKHPDDVRVIELTQADSRLSIRLDRINDRWELTAPVSVPADPVTINGPVLGLTRATSRAHYQPGAIAPDKVGLEPPRWQVRFDDLVLHFGDVDPAEGLRYVRVGDSIHRIEDIDPALFDADYSDLISRRLIPPPQKAVRVTAQAPEPPGESSTAIAEAWTRAQAMQVRRATQADYADATGGVDVSLDNGDQLSFRIAPAPTALVLIRPELDLAYVMAASAGADLLPGRTANAP